MLRTKVIVLMMLSMAFIVVSCGKKSALETSTKQEDVKSDATVPATQHAVEGDVLAKVGGAVLHPMILV